MFRRPLRMTGVAALAISAVFFGCAAPQSTASAQEVRGTPHDVTLTHYTPLFTNAEILRRLLSPLAGEAVHALLARSHEALSPYAVDLPKEKFLVYVPSGSPPSPRGFALLVFVSPWKDAVLPISWTVQLEHYRVIFASPEHAGNATADLSRRVPLALAAVESIVREYPIDRDRVYIGGFSGGSRAALRIALGYPDVFRGALLDAGADPLGGAYPLPPRDLFQRFQSSSHLVYVTGELDSANLDTDASSSQSMRDSCVFDVEMHETPNAGHELMSSTAFGEALDRLLNHPPHQDARLDACRSHLDGALEEKLRRAETLVSTNDRPAARRLLLQIDNRYGGLAAPRILKLAQACGCGIAQSPAQ